MSKTRLDNTSEQNILNMLMESSGISADQVSKINTTSAEIGKTKLETALELNFTNEEKILKTLSSTYSLPIIDLSKKVHPMLLTRGVPGTHDISMMLDSFKKSKAKKFKNMKLPNFNKAIDDRFPKNKWNTINKRPDVIIFEGWCVGARAETDKTLKKSINSMEKANDHKLVWRKYVNRQLKTKYKKLYSQLNCMIYLKAKNFSLLQKWRLKQEHKLWLKTKKKGGHKIMSKGDVINFMQTYQRITQNMFKNMPKYASIILNLNSNHQIKTTVYKPK